MNLGVFLPLGGSLTDLENNGKLARLVDYYLPYYKRTFEYVYIFSYANEKSKQMPKGCILIANKFNIHRFFYAFLLPFLNWQYFNNVSVARVMQVNGIIPALFIKLLRKKIVVTYGYDYKTVAIANRNFLGFVFYLFLEKILLPICDLIIYSSKTIMKIIPILNTKHVYLPNGIDQNIFKPSIHKLTKTFNILVQARLTPEKNLPLLINAISRVDKNIELTIIGDGPLKFELENLAQKLKVKLNLICKVPNDHMPSYYNSCDLFVFPSITEGSPKALIEAASCGCAILASDIMQNREVLGDDGAIYFKFDKNELTLKITELISNPSLRHSLELNAAKMAKKNFDIEQILKEETKILESLV